MAEDLAHTPAERAAATERSYGPIHFFYSKERGQNDPNEFYSRFCWKFHGSGRFRSTSPTSFGNSDLEVEIKLQSA